MQKLDLCKHLFNWCEHKLNLWEHHVNINTQSKVKYSKVNKIKENNNKLLEKSPEPQTEEKSTYGSPEINFIIDTIKKYNHGICDWTQSEQRQYWKLLYGKLTAIQIEWFDRQQIFDSILNVISKNQYHSHKITWTKQIFYKIWELLKIAEQDVKKLASQEIKSF